MINKNNDRAQVMVPPPLVFLGYLIGALVLNSLVPYPTPWTRILQIIGGLLLVAGILLVGSAFSQMRIVHTTPDLSQSTTALVTSGPYRFTRNPIYLGFLLIYLGFTFLAGSLWGIIISPFLIWTVTHAIIHVEEDYLEKKFEDEYREYSSHVRRWI
jgi:protein-S-isoprenylcysteine O-methyltransferase Ste14